MISLFDKELMQLEREVRDLKTSHEIPLGALNFYAQSATVAITWVGLYIRATIKEGELAYPYIQFYIDEENNHMITLHTHLLSVENEGKIVQSYISLLTTATLNVRTICTSDFDMIAKPYEEGDWIGEGL